MGTLIGLDDFRAERQTRLAEAAERASFHPALRWCAGQTFWLAHRRDVDGAAACGTDGELTLAPPGVPLCAGCYPQAMSGD
jgi:hypothetical protein